MRKSVLPCSNNKGADQPAHTRSLISAFGPFRLESEKNGGRDRRYSSSKMADTRLSRDLIFENESTEEFQTCDDTFYKSFCTNLHFLK